jgi:hypothetical protein
LFFENLVLALLWWRDFSRDDGQLGREAIELGIRQRLRRGERTWVAPRALVVAQV